MAFCRWQSRGNLAYTGGDIWGKAFLPSALGRKSQPQLIPIVAFPLRYPPTGFAGLYRSQVQSP